MIRELTCGCRTCGCVCAKHSGDRIPRPCGLHTAGTMARFIAEEAAALVAISLLIGCVAVWCTVFAMPIF